MRERGGLMKEKRFQILSLALNVVLLIALLMTRAELADTQNSLKNQLDSVAWRLMDVQDQITDLSVRQREQTEDLSDFSFEPTGLDPESHTLQADMSITLRRWTADTEVTLLVTQNGRTTEQPMSGTAACSRSGRGLPVEDTGRSVLRGEYYCRRSDQAGKRSPVTVTLLCCCPCRMTAAVMVIPPIGEGTSSFNTIWASESSTVRK